MTRWLTQISLGILAAAVLHFYIRWNWPTSLLPLLLLLLFDVFVSRLEERIEGLHRRSVNDAVWLTLNVIAKHGEALKEYQEACGQVEGFQEHFAPELGPADTLNDLVERRAAARSRLQAAINENIS